jgi:triosephosphate isomerase
MNPLIAGNWKMHGEPSSVDELGRMIARAPEAAARGVELIVCPPAIMLARFAERATVSPIRIGAQDCHPEPKGAHTGDISAEMIKAFGGEAVIVGHSERRADHGESDALVARKAAAAARAGLLAIICVGETEAERDSGEAEAVVSRQVQTSIPDPIAADGFVVAYEPVWAIGTGRTPTSEDIAAMHRTIRGLLRERFGSDGDGVRILYGGSVKPANAADILKVEDVGGALVGGASLKADDFLAIAAAAPDAA